MSMFYYTAAPDLNLDDIKDSVISVIPLTHVQAMRPALGIANYTTEEHRLWLGYIDLLSKRMPIALCVDNEGVATLGYQREDQYFVNIVLSSLFRPEDMITASFIEG
jgi:hypothetical protein